MSVTPRLNRLFAPDGRCLLLALDHAQFNRWDLLDGIQDLDAVIARAARAGVDGILLCPGQAMRLQSLRLERKPALVLRCDVANVYATPKPEHQFSRLHERAVERAVRLDAAAVLVNFFLAPDSPSVHEQSVANLCRIKADCERFGMPLMVEPLVLVDDPATGGYAVSGCRELVLPLHRQAVELGADILKSDPTDSPADYAELVRLAGGVPVLPRGGGRVDTLELLSRTAALIQAGASGVVYGRNIFQHPRMEAMIRGLRAIIHEGASAEAAAELLD